MASNSLVALAAGMRKALSSGVKSSSLDKAGREARMDLMDMIPDLQRKLTGDRDTIRDMTWSSLNLVSLQAISRFNLAKHVPIDSNQGMTYTELAKRSGMDEMQMKRLLRHAMTNQIFHEPSKNHVAHTSLSKLMATDSKVLNWVRFLTDAWWPVTTKTIDAVSKWPGSTNPTETGVSLVAGKKTQWFEEIAKMEGGIASFRDGMGVLSEGEGWEDRHLVEGFAWGDLPKNATVVDIGGADGHQSVAIANVFPDLRFVVQDVHYPEGLLSEHYEQMDEAVRPRVRFMEHDMFQEQPVKHADVYFWRVVLHNWPDDAVVKALKAIVPAMKPGAHILIHDHGLADPGTGRPTDERYERILDIMMMTITNSKERQMDEWATLFNEADPRFKFKGGHKQDGSRLWTIEAVWEPKS